MLFPASKVPTTVQTKSWMLGRRLTRPICFDRRNRFNDHNFKGQGCRHIDGMGVIRPDEKQHSQTADTCRLV